MAQAYWWYGEGIWRSYGAKQPRSGREGLSPVTLSHADIMNAFDSPVTDYEDAVIAECASRSGMDFIVTRDTADFKKSAVAPITPMELVPKLRQ